ncbi:MAG: hypothetical protein U9Q81_11675 [Pseudomonadota bacterium]|nr:hypothetical protein [Pseudomonadota bacterium]
MDDANFLQRLSKLIGRDCRYLGKRCRLIEILADEGTLVLETREQVPPIQIDQYGQPVFRANEVVQIPIFGADPDQFSDELMDVLACLSACSETNGTG